MIVSLVGLRGTGKSTVARHLALRLGWDWADSDVEVELQAGKSVAAIFADDGEPAFRELEATVLQRLAHRERLVLATGGGAVLRDDNRRLLARSGLVVWLQARPSTIQARLEGESGGLAKRPALSELGTLAEIETVAAQREPLYRACATVIVSTDDAAPAEIVERIVSELGVDSRPA